MLSLDSNIRFAGIANEKSEVMGSAYRAGVKPLLSPEETQKSIMQSVIRAGMRTSLESKLGKTVYAFAMYEKMKRVTIPLKVDEDRIYIFMVSFDLDADHEPIILNKIIPMLRKDLVV